MKESNKRKKISGQVKGQRNSKALNIERNGKSRVYIIASSIKCIW